MTEQNRAKVYFIPCGHPADEDKLQRQLMQLIREKKLLGFIEAKDLVAVKTHFGEAGSQGYVRPHFFKGLADLIRRKNGKPFLTETSTLYVGQRSNAVDHLQLAYDHGFTPENTDMGIIMADGLLGDEETEVPISGIRYPSVRIATLAVKAQALVLVSHFTGHVASGFGAALKNLGMGLASRRGKLIQHSTATPSIKSKKCTACGMCIRWCPSFAIRIGEEKVAEIDAQKCIGCAECLAVCRFDAVAFNWSETYEALQEKITEHAFGVYETKRGKGLYINFLTRITRDCDCMNRYEPICQDIGILVGLDPVALDAASLDLVESRLGQTLDRVAYDIPIRRQLEHAAKIGFGTPEYHLLTLG